MKLLTFPEDINVLKDNWLIELGLEIFYQASGQILLLLLSLTNTKTTGGLQTMFEKSSFLGMDPILVLKLSIVWSMFSCLKKHLKSISKEKIYFPMKAKFSVFLWGQVVIILEEFWQW